MKLKDPQNLGDFLWIVFWIILIGVILAIL